MQEYVKIFVSFFKIGLFTFGGGYAMIPMFRKELIEKHGYITEEELMDYYSIGQCTPGIIAINVATFTGYKIHKTFGAIVATMALVLPSLIVIMMIANFLGEISDNKDLEHAFNGIRIGVVVLLVNEVIGIAKKNIKNRFQIIVLAIACLLVFFFNLSSVVVVLLAGIVGAIKFLRNKQC
jgi:chromate transporter